MPFYEYECSACKFYVELLQKISDPPLKKCPSCAKQAMQRLMSAPVFRLKGSGWYETDFKSDNENKRKLADEAGAPRQDKAPDKTEAKGSDKAEDKTAEKPEEKVEKEVERPVRSRRSVRRGAVVKTGIQPVS